MNAGIISSRYAKAFLKFVQEKGAGANVYSQACSLVRVMNELPQLKSYLENQGFTIETKQQEKFEKQPRQSEREYVSGETLYVFGQQYFLRVEYSYKGNSLVLSGNEAILTVRKESTPSC